MRFLFFIFLFCHSLLYSQTWTWTTLSSLPKRVSNNAVSEGTLNGIKYVFSFGGIDSTKSYTGIHNTSFRYNTLTNTWQTIADIPDTLGKIAAAASTVNNIIYVIGGYHVLANGNEISSNKVHRYDVQNNTWLSDGTPLPLAIDDHVQCVWRDSLIYVITGWSNTSNRPNVQIYNPYTDVWLSGNAVPNNNSFIAFGAAGTIIGDTIYYYGGTSGSFSFVARNYLRRGIINPLDPTDITWTQLSDSPGDAGYRMAIFPYKNNAFWIDGAGTAYNYDGIAYNGSGGVEPSNRILQYNINSDSWIEWLNQTFAVMDIRGQALLSPSELIICGGMQSGQSVSNAVYKISLDTIQLSIHDNLQGENISVFPNPSTGIITISKIEDNTKIKIYSVEGRLVHTELLHNNMLNLSHLPKGMYVSQITYNTLPVYCKFIIE